MPKKKKADAPKKKEWQTEVQLTSRNATIFSPPPFPERPNDEPGRGATPRNGSPRAVKSFSCWSLSFIWMTLNETERPAGD
jgi:hypothetical protein